MLPRPGRWGANQTMIDGGRRRDADLVPPPALVPDAVQCRFETRTPIDSSEVRPSVAITVIRSV